jgi:hypothetical protein
MMMDDDQDDDDEDYDQDDEHLYLEYLEHVYSVIAWVAQHQV